MELYSISLFLLYQKLLINDLWYICACQKKIKKIDVLVVSTRHQHRYLSASTVPQSPQIRVLDSPERYMHRYVKIDAYMFWPSHERALFMNGLVHSLQPHIGLGRASGARPGQ